MSVITKPTLTSVKTSSEPLLDIAQARADFPILKQLAHGHPLIYLDNASTTQKPQSVIDAMNYYYQAENANIHRGIHLFSERATKAFEGVREKVKQFINSKESCEIIFVRGTTEAINLVAQCYGRPRLQTNDEILITAMEHHSNIVPWQMLCEQTGAVLKVAPINHDGELIVDEFQHLLSSRTRLVAISHMSNALGTINPVRQLIEMAHQQGIPVLLDGAQAISHTAVDMQHLDCDFYAFSGHKMYGPTGIGVLYGKAELLRSMTPYHGGGDMISQVSFSKTVYKNIPYKFEAGTPDIAGVIGLGAAIDYLNKLGLANIAAYEHELLDYTTQAALTVPGLKIIGTAKNKASILAFTLANAHPHDIGTILDHQGIAIRAGHHCAMPLMDFFKVAATTRASLAFYNTQAEIDSLIDGLKKVQEIFG